MGGACVRIHVFVYVCVYLLLNKRIHKKTCKYT